MIGRNLSLAACTRAHSSVCLQPYELQPTRLLCSWDSPGKNTGAGCHALLQGIFPTQGSNLRPLRLLLCQVYSLALIHWRSPCAWVRLSNLKLMIYALEDQNEPLRF